MASSTTRSRPGGQHRSLPTLTLFNHPAARLIKTIPPLQPPTRINGHVPTDSLGAGRISNTDVVLADVYGPLSVLMVPDPLDPTIATLVLSVGIQDAKLQGAARRFVLPFRSFQRDSVSGQLISQSQIRGFDAADRTLYPGLGAGLKGLDGGSFWFFEDVGEEGAFDRYRWEKDRVGRRAIWTVWLISTPAPILLHVQNLLQSYPAPLPPLPPWLEEDSGYPWRDTFVALPSASALTPTILKGQLPTDAFVAIQSTSPAAFPVARPLHAIPQVPVEPEHLRGESCISTKATSADIDASDAFQDTLTSSQDQSADPALKTYVDDGPTPTTSQLTVRSRHLRHASSSVTIGDGPEVIMHNAPRTTAISEYRNSLIAVDNLTGQIIGVLASDINLHSSSTGISQPVDVAAMTSSDQVEANAEDEEEIQTPLDEHTRILHSKGAEDVLGMQTAPASTPEEPELPKPSSSDRDITTPRPCTFIHRPAPVYRDAAVASSTVAAPTPPVVMPNIQTEPRSILDVDTFAPPPLPLKQLALRAASRPADITADAPPSRCTSTASAAFFSAESDTEAVSSYDSDALEIDARSITHDNLPTSFISMRGKTAKDIERHRPELLQDQGKARRIDDDDVESDASGSTVGGPAVRMWRKARAKGKKKPSSKSAAAAGAAAQVTQPRQGIKSRQASEMSDRTSKAETAFEALSDNEDSTGAGDDAPPIASLATAEGEAGNVAPLLIRPTGPGHHLPRSALRTDEVRSIEDRVWREALDAGQLPIDAPYTHLAARGDAGFYPSSILSSPPSSVDGSAIELLSAQDKAREAQKKKKRLRQQNQRAERIMNMQGGTVLIEFLAGSSRIGASLIRSAGLDTGAAADQDRVIELQASAKTSEVASNVLGYVPLLPQHLLSFFGLSSTSPQSATNAEAAASKAADAPPSSSYLSGLRLPAFGGLLSDASDWVTNLFSFNSAPATSPTNADSLGDPSRAEEWEYAIPEFDPNSLSSTPRPVYRRKRPVPSAMNGFNISAPLSAASKDVIAESAKVEQAAAQPSTSSNEQRYSILHIDSLGIGRRAFLRGIAGA